MKLEDLLLDIEKMRAAIREMKYYGTHDDAAAVEQTAIAVEKVAGSIVGAMQTEGLYR